MLIRKLIGRASEIFFHPPSQSVEIFFYMDAASSDPKELLSDDFIYLHWEV